MVEQSNVASSHFQIMLADYIIGGVDPDKRKECPAREQGGDHDHDDVEEVVGLSRRPHGFPPFPGFQPCSLFSRHAPSPLKVAGDPYPPHAQQP